MLTLWFKTYFIRLNVIRLLCAGTLIALPAGRVSAQLAALPIVAPVMDCAQLARVDISTAVGAKTHITSSEPVAEGKPAPYCRVTGYVEPMVKFEVRLPLRTWTQRFVQTGCGGLCGNLQINLGHDEGCYPAQHGELVLSSTDMGHTGGMDGQFGEKDYQLRIDFAYRGVHVSTLATKALILAYYGQGPKYSYFAGCSDGGREALMEAQRYPNDFNGITAGAPAMNFTTQNTFYHGWNAIQNTGGDGLPLLMADKLPVLHKLALKTCDAADGLVDGLISDPFSCHVDPALVECKQGADTATCLTHAEVGAARAIYEGAHTATGEKLVLSGPLPGSELAWAGVYVPSAGRTQTMSRMIATGTLKYLAYEKNLDPSFKLADLQYTASSFAEATRLHSLYDATDPDLGPFQKAGGKLILWHGLADPHISPLNTIAYYTAMNKVMGQQKVEQFSRLYLFPGGYHCAGGEGPFDFDLIASIMAWVEKGKSPDALLASHRAGTVHEPIGGVTTGMRPGGGARDGMHTGGVPSVEPRTGVMMELPAESAKADAVRPVYPYPVSAKYTGTGSPREARNFGPGPEKLVPSDQLQWLGASFYTPHYEQWCKGEGASMTCTDKP